MLFAVVLTASALMGDAPQKHLIAVAVAGAALAALAVMWVTRPAIPRNITSYGLMAFLASIAISLPVALSNGTTVFDWAFRAAAPLALMGVFFLAPLETEEDEAAVLKIILAACVAWAALSFWQLSSHVDLLWSYRWTALSNNLIVPFNLVAIAVLLFGRKLVSQRMTWLLLLIFGLLTVGGGYRSHIAIIVGLLAAFAVSLPFVAEYRRRAVPVVLIAGLAIAPFYASGMLDQNMKVGEHEEKIVAKNPPAPKAPPVTKAPPAAIVKVEAGIPWLRKFLGSRDGSRVLEIEYAYRNFMESPLVGKGLAFPIPSEIHFYNDLDYLHRLEAANGKTYPYVYMMHNFPASIAMTMGLLGLASLGVFFIGLLSHALRGGATAAPAFAAIAAICVFSLISAAWTLPQFSLLIGGLAAVVSQRRGRQRNDNKAGIEKTDKQPLGDRHDLFSSGDVR
ncbi:O-antigen ligase family protein [Nitratireductor arenosus]|nr:O-antigen ligase family protein [Nitratireductor arenosus]